MTQEDLMMAREIRQHLERRAIDGSLTVISCNKGYVTLTGSLRHSRTDAYAEFEDELEMFKRMVMRNVRGVKSLVIESRMPRPQHLEKKEHVPVVNPHTHAPQPNAPARPNIPGRH